MPKISFIIPVYKVEKYIDQCIESILNQTFQDFEVILIDDGSPDNCPAICDKFAKQDNRVKVIHKKNAGVDEARNTGIEAATGEWAYFVDSDDWLELDAAETLYNDAIRTGADCVMSDCVRCYDDGRTQRIHLFSQEYYTEERKEIENVQKFMLCHKFSPYYIPNADSGYAAPWGKFVKMSILKDYNVRFDNYAKGVFDDGVYSLYLLEHVKKFYYNAKHTYDYRIVGSSLTNAYKANAMEILKCSCELIDEFIEKTGKDESFKQAEYCRRVSFFACYLSKHFYNINSNEKSGDTKARILKTLDNYPYNVAFRNAEYRNLPFKHAYILFCGKHRLVIGMKLYAALKRGIKKD